MTDDPTAEIALAGALIDTGIADPYDFHTAQRRARDLLDALEHRGRHLIDHHDWARLYGDIEVP